LVLLNLAYLPDEVIKGMTSFEPNWSLQFKELMTNYWRKEQFANWNRRFEEIKSEVNNSMPSASEDDRKAKQYA
jgi:hypothetical protein